VSRPAGMINIAGPSYLTGIADLEETCTSIED